MAARLPAWSAARSRLENLEMRINVCRTLRQGQDAWPWESEPLLAMTTLVAGCGYVGKPLAQLLEVRIAGLAEGFHLSAEDCFIAKIVGNTGHHRMVGT